MIVSDASIIVPWVCEKAGGNVSGAQGIGRITDCGLVAGAIFWDWNGYSVQGSIRSEPGGMSKKFVNAMFDYPFNVLGAQNIIACVDSKNQASQKLVKKLGFAIECTLNRATPDSDIIFFRLWKKDCRFLGGEWAA